MTDKNARPGRRVGSQKRAVADAMSSQIDE